MPSKGCNDTVQMEFLRFGSSIPGSYWGCCAMDIIQCFKVDPDAPASIQLAEGDGGGPLTRDSGFVFAGPTWRDIFWQRIRFGTFDTRNMPNHGFLAILTDDQVNYGHGKAWLAILKEAGFEFIRTVSNSVYDGNELGEPGDFHGVHPNYLFGLFRNIGDGNAEDQFTPPSAWTSLPDNPADPKLWALLTEQDRRDMTDNVRAGQLAVWTSHEPKPLLAEKEVEDAGAPVIYAALRTENPQELKSDREARNGVKQTESLRASASVASPAM